MGCARGPFSSPGLDLNLTLDSHGKNYGFNLGFLLSGLNLWFKPGEITWVLPWVNTHLGNAKIKSQNQNAMLILG